MTLHRAVFVCALLLLTSGVQAAGPQPPCATAAIPAYPSPDSPPMIGIWQGSDLEQINWHPPGLHGAGRPIPGQS